MTTIGVSGECFFRYRLTRVVPDKIQRAVWLQLSLMLQYLYTAAFMTDVTKWHTIIPYIRIRCTPVTDHQVMRLWPCTYSSTLPKAAILTQ